MIHTYKYKENYIVIDTYSGSIHLFDEIAYTAVQKINEPAFDIKNSANWEKLSDNLVNKYNYPKEDVKESLQDINTLIEEGSLFSEDTFKALGDVVKKRPTNVKALCMNVAHTCNLDCNYCFASQGKYHGERALMPFSVAKQAIHFLIENSGLHKNLDIDFFGGEPLMNIGVVKETVEYAKSLEKEHNKNFKFTLTTNGMLLNDEISDYLNENMVNVVLSLDGRKHIHDSLRHTITGQGSYDIIVPKFQHFVENRGDKEYYLRGTYTKNNLDFTNDVFHMADLGFHRLSMEPVIGDPNEPYMLSEKDLPFLEKQYEILADEMIRRNRCAKKTLSDGKEISSLPFSDQPFIFYHFMLDLEHGPCIYKRISGCGSGTEYLAVTPNGDLFPCHQFVGEEAYAVGNVFDGISNETLVDEFKQCNVYSRPECESCWAKLYCSGGCSANALHATGSLTGTVPFSCDLFRKRVECAIAVKVDEMLSEVEE